MKIIVELPFSLKKPNGRASGTIALVREMDIAWVPSVGSYFKFDVECAEWSYWKVEEVTYDEAAAEYTIELESRNELLSEGDDPLHTFMITFEMFHKKGWEPSYAFGLGESLGNQLKEKLRLLGIEPNHTKI